MVFFPRAATLRAPPPPPSLSPSEFSGARANPQEWPRASAAMEFTFRKFKCNAGKKNDRASGINNPVRNQRAGLGVTAGVEVTAPQKPAPPPPPPHWAAESARPLPGLSDLSALPREPPNLPLVNKAFISQASREEFQAFIIKCPGEGQLPKPGAGCPSGGGWMVTTHHPCGSPAVSYGGRISQRGRRLVFTVHGCGKPGAWLGWG